MCGQYGAQYVRAGEEGKKVKAKTRSVGSTQLAIRIVHDTHVGRVRRVHVRSETVHRSAELAAGVAQIETVSS
jgi:hypothetical protein